MAWKCNQCQTTDMDLYYSSGKMKKCKDCQRFYNVGVNSKRVRKNATTPQLLFSKADFLAWCRGRNRVCRYCRITEIGLAAMGLKSQIGLPVTALGIDRLDSDGDYELANIDFCCFACNKAKGNVFTTEEMEEIGPSIAAVWAKRLA